MDGNGAMHTNATYPSLSEKAHSKQCNAINAVSNAPQYNSSSYNRTQGQQDVVVHWSLIIIE